MCIFHKYKIVKVQQYMDVSWGSPGTSHTYVLRQCLKCKRTKRKVIDGHWDFTELTGLPQKSLGGGVYIRGDYNLIEGPITISVNWKNLQIFKDKYPDTYKQKFLRVISKEKLEELEDMLEEKAR